MKKACLLLISVLFAYSLKAQNSVVDPAISTYPVKKTQIGWYYGDFIHSGSFVFDIANRWEGRHAFGFSFGYLKDHNNTYTTHTDTMLSGIDYRIYHKFYLMGSINDNFIYLRHGIRMKETKFSQMVTDFYEFEELGNTFLRKETRQENTDVSQIGYEVVIGGEIYRNIFFLDYYFGAGYYTASNVPRFYRNTDNITKNDPRRTGSILLLGFRAGVYLN